MMRAILTFAAAFAAGVIFMVIGFEFLNGFPELGCIAAVSVAGGLTVYFNGKKKD